MKNQEWLLVILYLVVMVGYMLNVYKLVACDLSLSEFTTLEVVRVVGIFVAPLGVIVGWF